MEFFLYLAVGIAIGGALAWFILRGSASALHERLAARDSQLDELRSGAERAAGEVAGLRAELKAEAERRATAEEKNQRIGELEAVVAAREEELRKGVAENGQLQAEVASLLTRLQEERKGAEEKLAMLE